MRYTYGTITDALNIARTHKKGKNLNTLEKYQIVR
jgi:hypothetical protein